MSILPVIQRYQMLPLDKALFMQDYETKWHTVVVWRATTGDVLNGNSDIHANTKSHQGTIHIKVPSARGAEDFMQAM